jgi:hypothetical protein
VIVHEAEPDQRGGTAAPPEPGWIVAATVAETASAAATSIRRGMTESLAQALVGLDVTAPDVQG